MSPPLLQARSIEKSFAGIRALAGVSFDLEAGRLGRIELRGSEVILGAPLTFTKDNIDRYNF